MSIALSGLIRLRDILHVLLSSDLSKIVGILKDAGVGAAAVITAVVAIRGLRAWKTQLVGSAEYDLAKRLINAAIKLRDRVGELWDQRWSNIMKREEVLLVLDKIYKESRLAKAEAEYREKITEIRKDKAEMENIVLEAETLWGQQVRAVCDSFLQAVAEALTAAQHYLGRVWFEKYEIQTSFATISDKHLVEPEENIKTKVDELANRMREIERLVGPKLRKK